MKPALLALMAIAVFLMVSCTSGVRIDYDERSEFKRLRTYMWIEQPVKTHHPAVNNPLLREHVESAVDAELAGRGYRRLTSGNPDFWIRFQIVAAEKVDVTVTDNYNYRGYGYGYGPNYSSQEYMEGTVVIDVLDGDSNQVIWRGWLTRNLSDDPRPEEMQYYVQRSVTRILKEFPPES
jgi:hypothetical protein